MAIEITVMSLDFDSDESPRTIKFEKDELTLGRLTSNDLVLDRPEISAEHAKVRLEMNGGKNPQLLITDLGSSNGTMVENTSLDAYSERELSDDERVIIGAYLLKFVVIEENSSEEADAAEEDSAPEEAPEEEKENIVEENFEQEFNPEPTESDMNSELGKSALTGKVEDSDIVDLDFAAVQLFTVSGIAVHRDNPLAGVKIDGGELGTTVTGDDGAFSFNDVAEDTQYSVSASKENYVFGGNNIGTVGSNTSLRFSATKLLTIRGKVMHKGNPLVGVEIDGGALGQTVTGSDGSYCFSNVPENTEFEIKAQKDGYKLNYSGRT